MKQRTAKIHGVLFDMDGVVVDNMKYHIVAWRHMLKQHGITIGREEFEKKFSGRTGVDTIKMIFGEKTSKQQATKLSNEKEKIYRKMYKPHCKPTPGLLKFLQQLQRQRIPFALATSAPRENVSMVLGCFNGKKYFKTIVDATGIKRGKPNPEIFLKAAKKLKIPAKNCIVFEDALLGIEAAQRAKMKTVGVGTSHTKKELAHADLVIKNFKTITVKQLQSLLDKR